MNIAVNESTENDTDVIYVPFSDGDKSNKLDIFTLDNIKITSLQFNEDETDETDKFGRFKVYFGSGHNYFRIGCKGSGVVLDGIKYMADEAGMLDIKSINSYIHNRKVNKILEQL